MGTPNATRPIKEAEKFEHIVSPLGSDMRQTIENAKDAKKGK